MDTEQKKEKKPRCPNGTVRNKQGDCVPKKEKGVKSPKSTKVSSPKPAAKTARKTPQTKGTLKKYAKILEERRKCIQLQFGKLQ